MHIAIIGAGISGLLTALELIEHGCSVDILINSKPDKRLHGQAEGFSPDVPMALSTKCQ